MRLLTAAVSLTLASYFLTASASAKTEAGKYPRVYKGDEGIEVTVVPILPKEPKRALVLVRGIDTAIDDIVLLHRNVDTGKGTALETDLNDEVFWTLVSKEDWWGWKSLELTLPEAPTKKIGLWYDEKLSKKADAAAVAKLFDKQTADLTIAKVQVFKGDDEESVKKHAKGEYKRAVDDAEQACGKGISANLEWDSLKKGDYKVVPMASRCRVIARLLLELCETNLKDVVTKKVEAVSCSLGGTQKLTLANKTLNFQTTAQNNDDEAAMTDKIKALIK